MDVWYDEFELRIGRSISRSIDKGISNSNFGLLVLSKSFFSKNWTEYELKSLNSYEISRGDILLPIWKDVEFEEVREFSPYLADKFALTTNKLSIEEIAVQVIEVVNPDLFSQIHQKLMVEEATKDAKTQTRKISELKRGPIRHPKLNENLISRIRLIRASLWLCHPNSMEYWMNGFQRDLNIESEIRYWEHLSTCFLELLTQHNLTKSHLGKTEDIYKHLFSLLFEIGHSTNKTDKIPLFEADFEEKAKEIWRNSLPIYDIDEKLPFVED